MLKNINIAITVFLVIFSYSSNLLADEYADEVLSSTLLNSNADDPDEALGPPDTGYVTVMNTGTLKVKFTNNVCRENGTSSDDLQVHEFGNGSETFNVAVGFDGSFSNAIDGSFSDQLLDFSGVFQNSFFNEVLITSTSNGGGVPGADIDAIECLFSLGHDDIIKTMTGDAGIDVGLGSLQTGFSFTIAIINNTGMDGGLAGLTFFDAVPGEFDLDGAAETGGDGIVDGIDTTNIGPCLVSHDTSNGAKKKNRSKLEPEHIRITADNLDAGDTCSIEVFVMTDTKSFPKGQSPAYTPTSCAQEPGTITLNDGVKVFDDMNNLLLQDDSTLVLNCRNFTD